MISITSDLGESFLPYDAQLVVELLSCESYQGVIVWATIQWSAGMRHLPIAVPIPKSRAASPLRLRVGARRGCTSDSFEALQDGTCHGIVSAWSATFTSTSRASNWVERRFAIETQSPLSIWEETGDSIARHIWDAGVSLACNLKILSSKINDLAMPMHAQHGRTSTRIIELGSGCGIVGLALSQAIENVDLVLTDLPDARTCIERNMQCLSMPTGSRVRFQELDWDENIPSDVLESEPPISLVVASDCIYNADSSPALVRTLACLARSGPKVYVVIAAKTRHDSERVFFSLMQTSGFIRSHAYSQILPGDIKEEKPELVQVDIFTLADTTL